MLNEQQKTYKSFFKKRYLTECSDRSLFHKCFLLKLSCIKRSRTTKLVHKTLATCSKQTKHLLIRLLQYKYWYYNIQYQLQELVPECERRRKDPLIHQWRHLTFLGHYFFSGFRSDSWNPKIKHVSSRFTLLVFFLGYQYTCTRASTKLTSVELLNTKLSLSTTYYGSI